MIKDIHWLGNWLEPPVTEGNDDMKKIHIVLTPPVLQQLIASPLEYSMALVRLKQHTIVFSNTIVEKYERYFAECDLLRDFQEWYLNFIKYDFVEDVDSTSDDFEGDIISLLKQYEHSLIIKYDEIFACEVCSVLSLTEINENCNDNELSRQCVPTSFILPKGSDKVGFCKWLSELLADEKSITIVDRYIMSDRASGILKEIYIPTFPKHSQIYVYFGDNEKSQTEVSDLKEIFGNRIRMYSSISSDFHERYIIGDSIIISIGVGLDVFDCDYCDSRKDTNISVYTKTMTPTLPKKAPQHTYAYR